MSQTMWMFVVGTAITQVSLLVGVYVKIQKDLTVIKTRLQIDDAGKGDREKLRQAEINECIHIHEADCANYERSTGVIAKPRS